jgi:hypothetical protein
MEYVQFPFLRRSGEHARRQPDGGRAREKPLSLSTAGPRRRRDAVDSYWSLPQTARLKKTAYAQASSSDQAVFRFADALCQSRS